MSSDKNTVSDQTVSSLELTLGAAGGAFSESSEQSMMEGLGEDWSSPSSSTSPTAGDQPLLGEKCSSEKFSSENFSSEHFSSENFSGEIF